MKLKDSLFLAIRNILYTWYHFSNIFISCVLAKKMLNFLLKPFVMFPRYEEIISSSFVNINQDNLTGSVGTSHGCSLVFSALIFRGEGCDLQPSSGRLN